MVFATTASSDGCVGVDIQFGLSAENLSASWNHHKSCGRGCVIVDKQSRLDRGLNNLTRESVPGCSAAAKPGDTVGVRHDFVLICVIWVMPGERGYYVIIFARLRPGEILRGSKIGSASILPLVTYTAIAPPGSTRTDL